MKKLLAIVLALTLVLSLSAAAFATDKPHLSPTIVIVGGDSLPATTSAEVAPTVGATGTAAAAAAKIIANKDLTAEQQTVVDAALADVQADGVKPVSDFMVESAGSASIIVEADEGDIIYVIYPNGSMDKFGVEDLDKVSEGHYELPVSGDCVVVVAKAA